MEVRCSSGTRTQGRGIIRWAAVVPVDSVWKVKWLDQVDEVGERDLVETLPPPGSCLKR